MTLTPNRAVPHGSAADQHCLEALSEREREVLKMTAEGLAIKEIAAALKRSPPTIVKHRDSIMKKLGLHDRVGIATP